MAINFENVKYAFDSKSRLHVLLKVSDRTPVNLEKDKAICVLRNGSPVWVWDEKDLETDDKHCATFCVKVDRDHSVDKDERGLPSLWLTGGRITDTKVVRDSEFPVDWFPAYPVSQQGKYRK